MEGGVPLVSFGAPPDDRMSIAASEGESDQSGDDGSVPLPPSGRSTVPDSDPEMVAMLARAAKSVGLEWRPPPCPEPSRLDDWFLGVARAGSQGPTPVPFFPEVHDELTGTWTAPFAARNRSSGLSSLATLDSGAVHTEVPPAERSVAMQLCPRTASTWCGNRLEPVPPADMRSGFYSPYFIVPKKSGGLRPILDLRILNRALHRLPFKMLTPKRIFGCVRPQDWFAAIDLKDAYFHVSILPRHRPFLRFAFEGPAYQYKVLPFGLSLSPLVCTKVAEAALVPLREQGVRSLNYLDDWLILAQSRDQLCEHRDLLLSYLSQLGLQVNWEKSKLSPMQRISFLGMELDSVSQTAHLTQERAQSVLNCLNTFKNRTAAPLKQFQRLLGHAAGAAPYETASTLAP